MSNNNFVFKDNSTLVLSALQTAMKSAAREMAKAAEDAVQENMLYGYHDPHGEDGHTEIVDTGRLFDSIRGEVKRSSQNTFDITVGTEVEYAIYVHEGTRKLKARRFIRDAMQKSTDEFRRVALSHMRNG